MAQLTWREMQAPDLSTSLRGYQQFTSLLDGALGRAKGAVDEIDAGMDERANAGAMRIAAAVQDPEQAKALLANPALMNDRLNIQTIGALAARPTQLIGQAAAENNLATMKLDSSQRLADDALAGDKFRGAELRAAEGAGGLNTEQRAELQAINQRIAAAAGSIGSKNAMSTFGALSDAETGGLGRASTRLGMDSTRLGMDQTRQNMSFARDEHSWQVEDRNDIKAGQAATLAMQSQSYSPESALAAFSSGEFKNLTPGAKMYALQQLNSTWGNIYSPAQLGEMSGFSGSGGGGDYASMLVSLESGGNANARNGSSSATGLHQFTEGTWLGTIKQANPAWARGKSDAELLAMRTDPQKSSQVEQALRATNTRALTRAGLPVNNANLYAMHHFGSTKFAAASNDTPISSILTPQQIAANPYVRGKTKGQVIQNWAQRAGTSAASLTGQMAGASLRAAQDREGRSSAASLLQAAAEGPSNPLDVVAQLKQTDRFKGTSTPFLKSQLDDIVSRSNGQITYSMAGRILQDAARVNNSDMRVLPDVRNWLAGNSVRVNSAGDRLDRNYIDNEIKRAAGGGLVQDAVNEADLSNNLQTTQQAQAALSQARAEYQQVMARRAVQPGVAAQLPRIQARMDAAQAALTRAAGNLQEPRSPAGKSTGAPEGGSFWDTVTGMFTPKYN